MKRGVGTWVLLAAVTAVALGFVAYPVANVFVESWSSFDARDRITGVTAEHYRKLLSTEDRILDALWNSVWVSAVSTLLAGVIGVPLAFLMGSRGFPGRRLFAALCFAPLTLPPVVGMFAFWLLIGRIGLIPGLLGAITGADGPVGDLEGIAGVLVVHAYSFSVFFYAMTYAALQRRDPSQIEAARTLGASPTRILLHVTLPALAPALWGAAALSFMVSMGSFSAPLFLANGVPFLSVWIYQANGAEGPDPDIGLAAAESVAGAVICLVFLLLARKFGAGGGRGAASRGARMPSPAPATGAARWMLTALAAGSAFLLLLPQMVVAMIGFSDFQAWETGLLPPGPTFKNVTAVAASGRALDPILNSLGYSALALVAVLLLALAAAWLLVRGRFRGAALLDLTLMLPFALPGTVVAFSLLRGFNGPTPQTFGAVLAGTVWLLPVAYFVRCIPLALRPLVAAMQTADASREEAARTLGAGPVRTFRRVTLPHLRPALLAAALLVYVTCLGEFVASFMVHVPQNRPMGVQIYSALQSTYQGGAGGAAVYSLMLIGLMIAALFMQAFRAPGSALRF